MILLFFILCSQVNSFLLPRKQNFFKKNIINASPEYYHIQPNNIIITFNLSMEDKTNIQYDINEKTNNKFIIHTDNIYVSLHDYTKDNLIKITSTFQIFVIVHDILNDLKGNYILESKDYIKKDSKTRICSFYDCTKTYKINFICCNFNNDNMNYHINHDFKFIYDNGNYYKIIDTYNQKLNFTPQFIYSSIFKYKDMYWEKSNNVIYYREQFTFKKCINII